MEINADIVIKATKVNGVYSRRPAKRTAAPSAIRRLGYDQVIMERLNVMDMTAFTLCQENNMPILVLDLWSDDDLYEAVLGRHEVGTLIK